MKKGYIFPGQGSQFEGMGKEQYESSPQAKQWYENANDILGYRLTDVMFEGTAEELKATKITQPAVFVQSVIAAKLGGDDFQPTAIAGHSLGELTALTAASALSFEDGLKLVQKRALAMQQACEMVESTMAAVLGLDDEVVEKICAEVEGTVVAANYNCPGQLVISGAIPAVEAAVEKLKEAGARRALLLPVGGAFHSPLMKPAKEELQQAILATTFAEPICPVYQNVDAAPHTNPTKIQQNLIEQLTAPVRWTKTMQNMIADGIEEFVEVGGNGKTLTGMVKKVDRKFPTSKL